MTHQPRQHLQIHAIAETVDGKGTAEGVSRADLDHRAHLQLDQAIQFNARPREVGGKGGCVR